LILVAFLYGARMKNLLGFAVLVVFLLLVIRYIESHSIFFPMKEISSTPDAVRLSYEDVYFTASDGTLLNGWYIPAQKPGATLIFCHGNAGNISNRLDKAKVLHDLGQNVFLFDYRGYGRSKGSPSEAGVYRDAMAVYEYLTAKRKVSKSDIILYGESIGGAVAIEIARRVPVRALITEETFSSAKDMAKTAFPFIPYFLFSSRFDSLSKIKGITCPKLIIHSVDDEIVPFRQGEALFAAAPRPKTFLKLRGSHNTVFFDSRDEFVRGIKSFLEELERQALK